MNLVLLCPELLPSEGGIPRILRLYLRAVVADTGLDQIRVVTLHDPALPISRLPVPASAGRVVTFAAGGSRIRFIRQTLRAASGAHRLICGHVHLLAVARFARLFNPNLALYLIAHGIEVDRPLGPLLRWALRGTTGIWCVSQDTRRRLHAHHPDLPADRLKVLPNALDPTFETAPTPESPVPQGNGFILSVSRLDPREPYKGIELLLRAFALIRNEEPSLGLRIVGDGDDRPRLQDLVRELALEKAVQFTGTLSDADLKTAFASCRLFALPSSREGFGLVFLEAMAHGKACVGLRAGGVPEVIDDTSGVLADDDSVAGLVTALRSALHHPWNPAHIRARAQVFSFEAFSRRLGHAY